jgi:hypothetical protein
MLGGILPGSGYLREVAAFRLDHDGFARVPETTAVHLPSAFGVFPTDKYGSLQRFVGPKGYTVHAAADLTPSRFEVEDVHRIGVLDLRVANCDRHGGNILALVPKAEEAERSSVQLIPIDHGYVLPVTFEHLDFEWLWYPQAKQAFSATTLEYIAALDPDADAAILRELEIEEGAVQVMQAVTILLKKGADAGLTLRQIANLVRRPTVAGPSVCEELLETLRADGEPVDWATFQHKVEAVVQTMVQECP